LPRLVQSCERCSQVSPTAGYVRPATLAFSTANRNNVIASWDIQHRRSDARFTCMRYRRSSAARLNACSPFLGRPGGRFRRAVWRRAAAAALIVLPQFLASDPTETSERRDRHLWLARMQTELSLLKSVFEFYGMGIIAITGSEKGLSSVFESTAVTQ
jgi:hypothetical protein